MSCNCHSISFYSDTFTNFNAISKIWFMIPFDIFIYFNEWLSKKYNLTGFVGLNWLICLINWKVYDPSKSSANSKLI